MNIDDGRSFGGFKIRVNGQDCDTISARILKQVQASIQAKEGTVLSFDDIFSCVDAIYINEKGTVEDYEMYEEGLK